MRYPKARASMLGHGLKDRRFLKSKLKFGEIEKHVSKPHAAYGSLVFPDSVKDFNKRKTYIPEPGRA